MDCSDTYVNGWKDKSMYMFFEITSDGKLFLKAHTNAAEKAYEYFLDPAEMRYYKEEETIIYEQLHDRNIFYL